MKRCPIHLTTGNLHITGENYIRFKASYSPTAA
uniref:Uncharacterized protein n=1 Tax=Ciona intestinalis TaxID=7719 RepID=H2XL63_CIOIN